MLKEIVTANQHHAYRLLQCIAVASRPLRVEELGEILALDFDGGSEGIPELKVDWRWRDQQEAILSMCSSLIAIVNDGPYRVVQFSHFSVKEFLTSDRLASSSIDVSHFHILLEPAHTVIVRACFGILLQPDNGAGDAKAKSNSPLLGYAATHWVGHAQFENVSRNIEDGMRRLFDLTKPHFAAWLQVYDIGLDCQWDSLMGFRHPRSSDIPPMSPLYYSSLCGFRDLAAHLVDEHPQHVNERGGQISAHSRRHCATNTSTLQIYYISVVQTWAFVAPTIVLYCMRHRSMDSLISGSGYLPVVEKQTRKRPTTGHHSILL